MAVENLQPRHHFELAAQYLFCFLPTYYRDIPRVDSPYLQALTQHICRQLYFFDHRLASSLQIQHRPLSQASYQLTHCYAKAFPDQDE
jgi:hypothetical protein